MTKRILIVDDTPDILAALHLALTRLGGYAVTVAENGRAGLETWANAEPFDLVILDIAMPDLSGFEVAESMRAIEKETATAPVAIVFFSAYDEPSIHGRAGSVHARAVWKKPMPIDNLLREVAAILENPTV